MNKSFTENETNDTFINASEVDVEMKCTETDMKVLMFSSLFFLVPGIYGMYVAEYVHGIFSTIGSVVSFIYWIRPVPSWRLTLDLIVSKLLGVF